MVEEARAAGLGVTIHVGEEGGEMGRAEIGEVLELLRPDRIGHGILAAGDDELMRELREREVVLEICPTSNLLTKSLPDEDAVRDVFRTFVDNGVLFTIATDGPEMMRTHLRDEFDLLLRAGALTQEELAEANAPRPRGELHGPSRTPPARIPPSADSYGFGAVVACRAMRGTDEAKPDLTERQLQIVVLIARGCSNDEVGERLGISPRTAKAHCDVLRQKLGVPRRRQIPAAFKALTGEDPLARELAPALAGAGG